jgi:ribonuclease HII
MYPDFAIEESMNGIVAGVDEAGRGPLAGPVVVAAIIIDKSAQKLGINDSKKLTKLKREKIYETLIKNFEYRVAVIEPKVIDEINILQATMLGMREVILGLEGKYSSVIVDGNQLPIKAGNMRAVTGGDAKSLSIAAASIIAKVKRDMIMMELASEFPGYGWERNAGYGTREHITAIKTLGICKHHRLSFVRKFKPEAATPKA